MFNLSDLPDTIPVFPLPGALLLPRGRLPLHIFEPRYLAMLDDVLKSQNRLIGMVQPVEDPQSETDLHQIGCAGRVTAFSETDDGRYMITLAGISRFHTREAVSGFAPYLKFNVDWSAFQGDLSGSQSDPDFDRPEFLQLLKKYFTQHELDADWDSLKEADTELLINSLSMMCPFSTEDKQALLEAPHLVDRRKILTTLLNFSAFSTGSGEVMQ